MGNHASPAGAEGVSMVCANHRLEGEGAGCKVLVPRGERRNKRLTIAEDTSLESLFDFSC